MSRTRGVLVSCDLCNAKLFLKFLEKIPVDGGHSHYDQYQELPKSWIYDNRFGHLCPKCADRFKAKMREVFDGRPLPSAWETEADDSSAYAYVELHTIMEDT